MKLSTLVFSLAVLVTTSAFAQTPPCTSGTLANVLGTSCTIGNATFAFDSSFTGFHQFVDATNTIQTIFLTPDAFGFVPVISGNQNGFRVIANFHELTDPFTQTESSTDLSFTYNLQVNGNFQIMGETSSLDASVTQASTVAVSGFDEHCFNNQFCLQSDTGVQFLPSSGFSSELTNTQALSMPALSSTPGFSGLPFTTQLNAFAFAPAQANLNSGTFLFTIVPQVPLPALAKLTYTEIQVPGAIQTAVNGINDAGDQVGTFRDALGHLHGFVKDKDGLREITVPNAFSTIPEAINNHGDIAGSFRDSARHFHGFLFRDNSFTTFDFPGSISTNPFDINDQGTIVGTYQLNRFSIHGFRLNEDGFTTVDDPSQHSPDAFTEVLGTNDRGDIVGLYLDQQFSSNAFLFTRGAFQDITIPGGFQPFAEDINSAQNIVGGYEDLNLGTHGFVSQDDRFRTVDFPGSTATFPFQINASGQIIGEYFDDLGKAHSFLAERQLDDGTEEQPRNGTHHTAPVIKCTPVDSAEDRMSMKDRNGCSGN